MLASRPTPERRAFNHFLRTGQRFSPEAFSDEVKGNPNHDPKNGQFTSAPGGPFQTHARKKGAAGDTARALNRIVTDPKAVENIKLGNQNLKITRTGSAAVTLSMLGGGVKVDGTFSTVNGKQQVNISLGAPRESLIASAAASITSFPNKISIFESPSGQLHYTINKPIIVASVFGNVKQKVGTYVIGN